MGYVRIGIVVFTASLRFVCSQRRLWVQTDILLCVTCLLLL